MKKIILTIGLALLLPALLVAQATEGVKAESIGIDSAQQKLVEVSVNKFEDVAFWRSVMPVDQGIVKIRRFEGSPGDKEPVPGEKAANIQEEDRYVLGAKVQFFKRGKHVFAMFPVRPFAIEGLTKTISVWVVGRNFNHVLKAVISDYFGQRRELIIGKLNFMGWKKLTFAIPPRIVQEELHFTSKRGIKFLGFKVEFAPAEAYGTYYIYFDDLRATTDLFAEAFRDLDDMADGW